MIMTFASAEEINRAYTTGDQTVVPMPWKFRPYHSEIAAFTLGLIDQFGSNRVCHYGNLRSTAHRLQKELVMYFSDFPERPQSKSLHLDVQRSRKLNHAAKYMFVDESDLASDMVSTIHFSL